MGRSKPRTLITATLWSLFVVTSAPAVFAQTVEPPPVPENHATTPPATPANPEPNARKRAPSPRPQVKKPKKTKKPSKPTPIVAAPKSTDPTPPDAAPVAPAEVKPNSDGIIQLGKPAAKPDAISYSPREEDAPREDLVAKFVNPPARIFVGAHYGLTILPSFVTKIFARGAGTLASQRVGAQIEFYKPKFSVLVALDYVSLAASPRLLADPSATTTGNFGETFNDVGYFALVESQLKAISANVDFLWGFPFSKQNRFEFGLALGAGAVFGTLYNNWVYENPAGTYTYGGRHFSPCQSVTDGPGCRPQDHASPLPVKIGGSAPYAESSWFGGGSKPVVLPHLALPQMGLRLGFGDVAVRIAVGVSITGIFARLDGEYGLGEPERKPSTL